MKNAERTVLLCTLAMGLLLAGCSERKTTFTLRGEIPSMGRDTVLVVGANEYYEQADTIRSRHGRFRFRFQPDTITPLWVIFPGGHAEYLFAEKNGKVTIEGDSALPGHLTIEGGKQNALLRDFEAMLCDTALTPKERRCLADTFLMRHPFDEASVRILQKYYVDIPSPETALIRNAISKMSGNLQDNSYVSAIHTQMGNYRTSSTMLHNNLNLRDSVGEEVHATAFGDSCVLLYLWASWDEESMEQVEEMKALADTFASEPLAFLSVSLDNDRERWLDIIRHDSLAGTQTNNFEGWNLSLLRSLAVKTLPANVLLSPQRNVKASNLQGDTLKACIRKLLADEKARQEELKKAEKEKARNQKKKNRK